MSLNPKGPPDGLLYTTVELIRPFGLYTDGPTSMIREANNSSETMLYSVQSWRCSVIVCGGAGRLVRMYLWNCY